MQDDTSNSIGSYNNSVPDSAPTSTSNLGTKMGQPTPTQQSPSHPAEATKEVISPLKLAENLFPDDLSIRIGTQEI